MATHASRQFGRWSCRLLIGVGILVGGLGSDSALAATLHVPKDHKTIQAAMEAAAPGDTIVVAAGTYRETIKLKERVTLKSAGDDTKGTAGLKRAEATIIDGGGAAAKAAAVTLAEGAVLDGFTITRVGLFDQKDYDKHYATHGEELPDERGAVGAVHLTAVSIPAVTATVKYCIVHDNGYAGIGSFGAGNKSWVYQNVVFHNMGGGIGNAEGATPTVEGNRCYNNLRGGIGNRKSAALIINNECFDNVRAGIGIREGATPTVRGNKCYKNRRAGIGMRMEGTNPIIENNECYENEMAGIGNRDGAAPIIRNNRCYRNKMAGIGSRDRARALIENNECFENVMAGIGSRLEAAPIIRNNRCYRNQMAGIGSREGARPIIEGNVCFENQMAGIGSREEAAPIIRNNRCYRNGMAGIGSRLGARAVIVDNECFENQMAGIGTREGAAPVICRNRCYKNEMAGIGNRDGARSVIVDNESRENQMAGIGVRTESRAVIVGNQCIENRLVAIGLPDGASAYIHGNDLVRTEGTAPPIVAVRGGASAVLTHNRIRGGGVAGVLVQGTGHLLGNVFEGRGPDKQSSAVWVWDKSTVVMGGNRFNGYRNAINAGGSNVTAFDNQALSFQGPALIVRKPSVPARVFGNVAFSDRPEDKAAAIDGDPAKALDNQLLAAAAAKDLPPVRRLWPLPADEGKEKSFEKFQKVLGPDSAVEGPWKLTVTRGEEGTTYQLFNAQLDPGGKTDYAQRLPHIAFRMKGLLERQEGKAFKAMMRPDGKGK